VTVAGVLDGLVAAGRDVQRAADAVAEVWRRLAVAEDRVRRDDAASAARAAAGRWRVARAARPGRRPTRRRRPHHRAIHQSIYRPTRRPHPRTSPDGVPAQRVPAQRVPAQRVPAQRVPAQRRAAQRVPAQRRAAQRRAGRPRAAQRRAGRPRAAQRRAGLSESGRSEAGPLGTAGRGGFQEGAPAVRELGAGGGDRGWCAAAGRAVLAVRPSGGWRGRWARVLPEIREDHRRRGQPLWTAWNR
jgi:hypothetical protein